MTRRWWLQVAAALLVHPTLWWTGAVQALRLAPAGWWRRWPPVPVPDREYLRFRLATQYGDPARQPAPSDLIAYLRWCRGYGRVAG